MAKLEIRHADEASFLRHYFISGMSHNGIAAVSKTVTRKGPWEFDSLHPC